MWLLLLSASSFWVLNSTARAGEFALTVNDVSGVTTPWPLVGSLAFPEGEISDASAIRVVSAGSEVPAQIDVTATWRDGSIRWALAGLTASPGAEYRVEYGPGVRREPHPAPVLVTRGTEGQLAINTRVASYEFLPDKLLPERAWIHAGGRPIPVLSGSGAGAYLVDNRGRTARVAGAAAEVTSRVLKEGPGRFVVHRAGWYVTEQGERLARAEVWLYFAAGSANLRITHSLVLTEDTNEVWIRDYGLELRTPNAPERVVCALGESGEEDLKTVAAEGDEVFMLQDTYPHFAERESRAIIGRASGGEETVLAEFAAAGDWAHGDYGGHGLTVVMPWLAERFPKEISFGPTGARAVLWSARCGRELDFRGKTLVREYWQTWAEKAYQSPGVEALSNWHSNAQGAARTHDVWLLPRAGTYDEGLVRRSAVAAARPPLVLADPAWLCASEAYGLPMLHKDTGRFPEVEAVISEYWDRLILPLKAFPMTGFIAWGTFPSWAYPSVGGRVMANFHILSWSDAYGFRREPWRLYARSGERRYYEYGHRFTRHTGDFYLAHSDVPGSPGKERGAFVTDSRRAARGLPFLWGNATNRHTMMSGVISDWLLDYYLTGDERSLDLVKTVKESFRKHPKVRGYVNVLRTLVTLAIMDWDEDANRRAREFARSGIDLESQNGVHADANGGYGPMYKDARMAYNWGVYYLETGDELAREALLKLVDQRYRFDRRYNQVGYKNYNGFTYSLAYWMTGDERYRRVAEQTVRDSLLAVGAHPLSGELAKLPKNPLDWRGMPRHLGMWEWQGAFIGLPSALKLIAEEGWSGETTPLVVKAMDVTQAATLFAHQQGKETRLSLAFSTLRQDVKPEVVPCPCVSASVPVAGVMVQMEKRIKWPARLALRPDDHYHAFVTVPAETPDGLYLMSLGGKEPFTVLDATARKVALYCPDGFWSVSGTPIRRKGEGSFGRSGEGMPAFFRVPGELEEVKLLLGRPARVKAPDGSVAMEVSNENIGEMTIPVEGRGGIWSIEPHIYTFRGVCPPSFVRLLNVEPVVAFGSPSHLPEGTTGQPAARIAPRPEPAAGLAFVSGVAGQAVRLSGKRALSFTRGKSLEQGGYTHFPGATGTAEFWFLPDRATHETPMELYQDIDLLFLRGPHLVLSHRYSGRLNRDVWAALRLQLLAGNKGPSSAGSQWGHFFRGGEWAHIAYTWAVKEGAKGTESDLTVFLNGRPLTPKRVPYGLRPLAGKGPFKLSEEGDEIVLGPFAGAMDSLRLSDIVRYRGDFQPAKNAPECDEHTRALFLFDGNLKGASAFSQEPLAAR